MVLFKTERGKHQRTLRLGAAALIFVVLAGCEPALEGGMPVLRWYVFHEPSGAFEEAAGRCSESSGGDFRIALTPLPADADQQREQLVRRLAAEDGDIDLIGMDVIWTAEFAKAGWILPWEGAFAKAAQAGRLAAAVKSATFQNRLWATPFTTNTQLLWYRTDRVKTPPKTWDALLNLAESWGEGAIQAQGERYEGLTVFFTTLLASAGGAVLDESGEQVSLMDKPTRQSLAIMKRLATFPAADPTLAAKREDQGRLAFESGFPTFMINYTYVWPSAQANAPEVAARMAWARWPAVVENRPSRVTIGGINLGIGAYSRHPELAFRAALCIAAADNQRLAAKRGGLPPTIAALYDESEVRATFPFADVLRDTLEDAVQRAQTPVYNDISLAIGRTLHPMKRIDPQRDVKRLRKAVERALKSEGLL
ncbi:MAG: ABC transporter substrate-binding protein [Nitrospiria bacterium]